MSSVKEASKSQLDKLKLVNNPITRFDFVQKLEWFLLSAVLMILVIRTQLWLTNYPQLGGGGLHIAHLLWGGLFMMIAIWCSLIYLNRTARTVTAAKGRTVTARTRPGRGAHCAPAPDRRCPG